MDDITRIVNACKRDTILVMDGIYYLINLEKILWHTTPTERISNCLCGFAGNRSLMGVLLPK